MWLMSAPNFIVWLPRVQVIVSAYCQRFSSGKAARSRKVGAPNSMPFVRNTSGERPLSEVVGSPGSGGVLNSNSLSRPYWKRNSLRNVDVIVEAKRRFSESRFTKSLPKLLRAKVLVGCVWMPFGETQRRRL